MIRIENVSLSPVRTAIEKFATNVKKTLPYNRENKNPSDSKNDEFTHSDPNSVSEQKRTEAAIKKSNSDNEQRIAAEINISADLNNNYYDKLLQLYRAYNNSDLKGLTFTPVSEDTAIATYKGKNIEIKSTILEDGNKQQEINFDDGSHISYLTFTNGGKMKINEEEFQLPAGTIVETKSVNGRVFSKLIQSPDEQKKVVNLPEYLTDAEHALETYVRPEAPAQPVMPSTEFMLNILGKANDIKTLQNLSKYSASNSIRPSNEEIAYLEKSIAEGKIPKNTSITGANANGRKIITIAGENCKYEICDSEMRVIDNNGNIKMIARYESKRETNGLWVVSYDNGKPVCGSHYTPWDLNSPVSTVNYNYSDDRTVIVTTNDSQGKSSSICQNLPEDFCLDINNGLNFVNFSQSHLGSAFENQVQFIN